MRVTYAKEKCFVANIYIFQQIQHSYCTDAAVRFMSAIRNEPETGTVGYMCASVIVASDAIATVSMCTRQIGYEY